MNRTVTSALITVSFFTSCSAEDEIRPSSERMKDDVFQICSFGPRDVYHMDGLNKTKEYILSELLEQGYQVFRQKYSVNSLRFENLIVRYGDTLLPKKVVGAHYDTCDDQPGADDNASGVAGLLELARLLKEKKPATDHCLELVFYSTEEPPFFRSKYMGSYVHARSLKEKRDSITEMICLEMIGYYSDQKGSQDYPLRAMKLFYPSRGNYIAVVGTGPMKRLIKKYKKAFRKHSEIPIESLVAPKNLPGVDFSDHLNYWLFGFKAIMITDTAFYRNKNYHQKTDGPETLDYEKMAMVIKGVYCAITQS